MNMADAPKCEMSVAEGSTPGSVTVPVPAVPVPAETAEAMYVQVPYRIHFQVHLMPNACAASDFIQALFRSQKKQTFKTLLVRFCVAGGYPGG